MKYFIRSCKYVVYFALLFCVMVGVIWLLSSEKTQGLPVTALFKEGSLKNILIMFACIAAIYPSLSFKKRTVPFEEDKEAFRTRLIEVMDNFGMEIESEDGDTVSFRMKSRSMRVSRMWEDRITVRFREGSIVMDGYRRDVDRVVRILRTSVL